jgi:hypothetical protein
LVQEANSETSFCSSCSAHAGATTAGSRSCTACAPAAPPSSSTRSSLLRILRHLHDRRRCPHLQRLASQFLSTAAIYMQYIFGVSVISVLMEVPNRSLICTPLLLAALLSVHGRGEGNSDNMLDIQTCFFAFQINRFMNDLTLKFKAFALAQRRSLEQRLQMGPTAARKLCVWLWCRDELLKWLWLCGWEGGSRWVE